MPVIKAKKKPVVIECILLTEKNTKDVYEFIHGPIESTDKALDWVNQHDLSRITKSMPIHTLEGIMKASIGDYIIKGVNGEFYPCKPDIFNKTYDIID